MNKFIAFNVFMLKLFTRGSRFQVYNITMLCVFMQSIKLLLRPIINYRRTHAISTMLMKFCIILFGK